jgi:hypothetical protein
MQSAAHSGHKPELSGDDRALDLARALANGRGANHASSGTGVGVLVAGLFDTDPANGWPPGTPLGAPAETSWHSQLHFIGAVVLLLGLAIACFANTRHIAP